MSEAYNPLYDFRPIPSLDADANEAMRQIDDSLQFIYQNIAVGGGGVQLLDDLLDVDLTNVQDGDRLEYDSVSGTWQNTAGGVVASLNDLSDVTISSPRKEEILKYNGAIWENVGPEDLTFVYVGANLTEINGATTNIDLAYTGHQLDTLDDQTDIYTFNYTGNRLTSITVAPS